MSGFGSHDDVVDSGVNDFHDVPASRSLWSVCILSLNRPITSTKIIRLCKTEPKSGKNPRTTTYRTCKPNF